MKINYNRNDDRLRPKRKLLTCQLLTAVTGEGQVSEWYSSGTTATPVVIGNYLVVQNNVHVHLL